MLRWDIIRNAFAMILFPAQFLLNANWQKLNKKHACDIIKFENKRITEQYFWITTRLKIILQNNVINAFIQNNLNAINNPI